ncbi:FAD-dependent oxidoreductase [Sphingomonas sp. Leaf17]|uniref:FAD/NAD(P)-binding protein n=1 Tax=Sphingomonas sp. Leaf17 TaxID=1735683 RepID=UPI0006FA0AAD|nr:FAD/NAD(P)-binding protein [Sphingomonas sp. Leaf17]KQM64316.1 FAD-dependent oxidoreductase [Sphingomonas sp. Leaf17]
MTDIPRPTAPQWLTPDSHVVIVGGGFSGALMAINLFRFGGPRTTLVERTPARLGRGIAYGTAHPSQLLNVRAAAMSAFPDDPAHFTRWLAAREGEGGSPTSFVARATYGAYLREMLAETRAAAGARLDTIAGEVLAVDRADGMIRLALSDGSTLTADAVVLAVGNLPPHVPPGIDPAALPTDVYVHNPWTQDPAAGLSAADRVVLVGSGLTAIDMALQLDAAGFEGNILALSRRGLSPRRHVDGAPAAPPGSTDTPDQPLSALVAQLRADAAVKGWRAAVDALRPVTQRWWARADAVTRQRFLRHARPFWDVHRHRLAPAVADRIDALVAAGRLTFAAGKIVTVEADGAGARLSWRPRGQAHRIETTARRIVNCTGPQGDVLRSDEALLRQLIDGGMIRADALRLGIDVDDGSRVVDSAGRAQSDIYCVGPMTRGSFWEIVAVPDLRRQCADLARRLSNAHWVNEGL